MDLLPTIAEFCNVPPPDVLIDGKSLAPVCTSKDSGSPHEALFWMYEDDWAVLEGPWKIVGRGDDVFLANLSLDPTETTNYAASHRHVRSRLTNLYNRWILELSRDPNVSNYGTGAF
jgi:arylsulfatase A-like enzyme